MSDSFPSTSLKLWNLVQFQLGWFALVLSAAAGAPVVGGLVLAVLVLVHLRLSPTPWAELALLVTLGAVGWFWESMLVATGMLIYPAQQEQALMAPWWLAGLWINFGTALNYSLRWLHGRWFWGALLGAIGGPLAFAAGQGLGAVNLARDGLSVAVLSTGWLVLMPLASALASMAERQGLASRSNGHWRQV